MHSYDYVCIMIPYKALNMKIKDSKRSEDEWLCI